MLDWRGYVAESTGANIFLVRDGVIHTPTPDCFLDGITRRTVIQLAKDKGFEVVERHIPAHELGTFSEVFICGTAAEVTPVAEIGEHRYKPGNLSLSLMDDYAKLVRRGAGQGVGAVWPESGPFEIQRREGCDIATLRESGPATLRRALNPAL